MTNSNQNSQTQVNPSSAPIVIVINGIGHVPSMKNNKVLGWKWKGTKKIPTTRTKPEYKVWMDKAERSIASQLCSMCPTADGVITTECLRQFLTVSFPQDDNCWEVEIGSVRAELVPKGQEGATITIERI